MAKTSETTSSSLGIRLAGLQIYDSKTQKYITQNKYYGRNLKKDSLTDVLLGFFSPDIVPILLDKLKKLKIILSSLESYRFYTSSLLIVYDAECPRETADVRLIDFAHTTKSGLGSVSHSGPDSGFLFGLDNLISIISR